jgi:hypothetical protein
LTFQAIRFDFAAVDGQDLTRMRKVPSAFLEHVLNVRPRDTLEAASRTRVWSCQLHRKIGRSDLRSSADHESQLSPRCNHAFVRLNCSAIPAGLLESELFGHERGGFHWSNNTKGWTAGVGSSRNFFLDEVGDLPLELQPKIIRGLQEKEFELVGGTRTIWLVAATNRDLAKWSTRGSSAAISITGCAFPRHHCASAATTFLFSSGTSSAVIRGIGRCIETIPTETMQALVKWHWPGNVRELENFVERSVILSPGPALRAPLGELEAVEEFAGPTDSSLDAAEREHVLRVLRECKECPLPRWTSRGARFSFWNSASFVSSRDVRRHPWRHLS